MEGALIGYEKDLLPGDLGKLDLSLALVDSTVVRAHQHAAEARKNGDGDQALGRSRGSLSTKVHTVAVSESQVLGLILTGWTSGRRPVGEELLAEGLAREDIKAVGGGRAYDGDATRALIGAAARKP